MTGNKEVKKKYIHEKYKYKWSTWKGTIYCRYSYVTFEPEITAVTHWLMKLGGKV